MDEKLPSSPKAPEQGFVWCQLLSSPRLWSKSCPGTNWRWKWEERLQIQNQNQMEPFPMGPHKPHVGKEMEEFFRQKDLPDCFIHFTDEGTEVCGDTMKLGLRADCHQGFWPRSRLLLQTLSPIHYIILPHFWDVFMPQPFPNLKTPFQLLKLYIDLFHKYVLSS